MCKAQQDLTLTSILGDTTNETDTITAETKVNQAKSIKLNDGLLQSGGTLSLNAGNNVNILGANTQSGGDTNITARNDVIIGGIALLDQYDQSKATTGFDDTYTKNNVTWQGSNLTSDGSLNINAGGDASLLGANINAANDLSVEADNITVGTLVDQYDVHYY